MRRYRIWIVRCTQWKPRRWHDMPPAAIAEERAGQGFFSAEETADFVEGFNLSMLATSGRLWAVAVQVALRYEGDLAVGRHVSAEQLAAFSARTRRRTVVRGQRTDDSRQGQ